MRGASCCSVALVGVLPKGDVQGVMEDVLCRPVLSSGPSVAITNVEKFLYYKKNLLTQQIALLQ